MRTTLEALTVHIYFGHINNQTIVRYAKWFQLLSLAVKYTKMIITHVL